MKVRLKDRLKYFRITNIVIPIILALIIMPGCEWFNIKEDAGLELNGEVPVARANDKYLYESDLERIISNDMSRQDSAKRASNYVRNWLKKQLIISRSETELKLDQSEIERKILDYRYALIVHEFEKQHVDKNLDTVVTENEIEKYYEEKKDNFVLNQHIFRGRYVKLPLNSPRMGTFRVLFRSDKEEDMEELRSYCMQFALNYSLDEDQWFKFDEVVVNSPLMSISNKGQFLRNNKNYESNDKEGVYFLKIEDFRLSDQEAPMQFVKDQIKNIVIHKRKVELVDKLEEDIYNEANQANEIEIFE